jgi:hypothetical protein
VSDGRGPIFPPLEKVLRLSGGKQSSNLNPSHQRCEVRKKFDGFILDRAGIQEIQRKLVSERKALQQEFGFGAGCFTSKNPSLSLHQ